VPVASTSSSFWTSDSATNCTDVSVNKVYTFFVVFFLLGDYPASCFKI
jgi:hypothetical protein